MQESTRRSGGWMGAVLVGAVLGPAVQLQQPALWPLAWYIALALAAAAAGAGVRRAAIRLAAGTTAPPGPLARPVGWTARVLLAAAVFFALAGVRAAGFAAGALDPALEGRDIALTGIVAAMPQRNELGLRLRFEVETATAAGVAVRLPPLLQLGWYGGAWPDAGGTTDLVRPPPAVAPGERWQWTARLKAPHGNLNPHGFDYELWLWEQGVQATGTVRAGARDAAPQRLAATWRHPVEQARHAVREAILARVPDRRIAGVLAALVVGDQAAIERADWDVFRATGVAHLMSISGLHVTMFAWAAGWLVGSLWRRSPRLCLRWPAQHAALAGGILLAAGYALFSGWGVPAQRTVWMLATVGLLRLAGRRWPWPWTWLLACAVVVTLDPWALMQAGFWLSFVAVGVLFASNPAGAAPTPPAGPLARLGALVREQWVVTLALAPLTLLLFGQLSVVGLVANLVAIPWVTLLVTPLALGGVLAAPMWDAAGWAVQALILVLERLAVLPFATVSVPAAPLWAGAAGLAGGLLLAMRLPWGLRALGLPLLVPVLLWQAPRPEAGEFELLAADVGQGNAVLVRTAAHTLVYDAGPRYSAESDAGHRVVVPLLRALDERVDTLVLSHRDTDHTGGAAAVLAMQGDAALLSSIEDGHALQALRPARRCVAGQHWDWDGVRFEVLHPRAGDYDGNPRPNAISCVLRVGNGREAVLLAGDIEQAQEARLAAGGGLRARLLLAPHHGSKTSSSAALLDAVRPEAAIVQAGYRNRFGHPAPPVLARYQERGIRVVESARCGAAHWQSARPVAVRCERDAARRYWHHVVP